MPAKKREMQRSPATHFYTTKSIQYIFIPRIHIRSFAD